MRYCHKYAVSQGWADADVSKWRSALYQMWFSLYR